MISVRCPICDTKMEGESIAEWPFFPFCSKRCKTIDLGRWLKGAYAVEAVEPEDHDDGAETDIR